MSWIEVVNLIKDVGVSMVIVGAVIYLLVKYFSNMIDNKKADTISLEHNKTHYDSVHELRGNHPFFHKVKGIIQIKLPITTMGGPVRTEIFRDVLKIFYKTAFDEIEGLLNKTITADNFLTENQNTANEIVGKASRAMLDQGIPPIVVEKFNYWNYPRHEYLLSTIGDIDSSTVFSTILEKECAVLNAFTDACFFTLMDAEKTLVNLNGDLSGTVYKGNTVETLH